MTCNRIRAELALLGYSDSPGPAQRAHLARCELCRRWHEDWKLGTALAAQPVPAPSAGFADRALARAARQGDGRHTVARRGSLAAAAAVLLMVTGIIALSGGPVSGPDAPPGTAPVSRLVNVVIDAKDDRSDARVTVEITGNLELEGYGGQRLIEWQTDLRKGRNLLALPVRVKEGASGDLRVALSYHGGTRKEMHIPVRSG